MQDEGSDFLTVSLVLCFVVGTYIYAVVEEYMMKH